MILEPGKFSSYNKEVRDKAIKLLGGGVGYTIWSLYAGESDGYRRDISPSYIEKTYGISENSTRNALNDLRKYGFLIDHEYDTYGCEFYCESVVPDEWLDLLGKGRTGKKAEDDPRLKDEYIRLIKSNLRYEDYTLAQQWLHQRGQMCNWPTEWRF